MKETTKDKTDSYIRFPEKKTRKWKKKKGGKREEKNIKQGNYIVHRTLAFRKLYYVTTFTATAFYCFGWNVYILIQDNNIHFTISDSSPPPLFIIFMISHSFIFSPLFFLPGKYGLDFNVFRFFRWPFFFLTKKKYFPVLFTGGK